MRRLRRAFLGVALLLGAACASGAGGGTGSATSDLITARDLRGTTWTTALEVLRNNHRLRVTDQAIFLRNRSPLTIYGHSSQDGMLLLLDGTEIHSGVPDLLRSIDAQDIVSIRILDGSQAGSRYGTDGGNGVLIVRTRNGG